MVIQRQSMFQPGRPSAWLRTVRRGWWYLPLIHLGLPWLVRWPRPIRRVPPPPLRRAGQGLSLAGAALTLWSLWTLIRYGQGTPLPHDPPQQFVCHGPYRRCRNPMELGNLVTLLGRTLTHGCPRLALTSAIFAMCAQGWIVLVEEPYLVRHFGARYQRYCQATPRWGWRLRPNAALPSREACYAVDSRLWRVRSSQA